MNCRDLLVYKTIALSKYNELFFYFYLCYYLFIYYLILNQDVNLINYQHAETRYYLHNNDDSALMWEINLNYARVCISNDEDQIKWNIPMCGVKNKLVILFFSA